MNRRQWQAAAAFMCTAFLLTAIVARNIDFRPPDLLPLHELEMSTYMLLPDFEDGPGMTMLHMLSFKVHYLM
jgi:hypothetical protein